MLVLGVDPGSMVTGYGLVEKRHNDMTCIEAGSITSSANIPFYKRIHKIFLSMVEIMKAVTNPGIYLRGRLILCTTGSEDLI